jgi:hypothetical protein
VRREMETSLKGIVRIYRVYLGVVFLSEKFSSKMSRINTDNSFYISLVEGFGASSQKSQLKTYILKIYYRKDGNGKIIVERYSREANYSHYKNI